MPEELSAAVFTDHARGQLARRGIGEAEVRHVIDNPESVEVVRPGRVVAQALDADGLLLRVFVEVSADPPVIVTAYRTSKLKKYRNSR
jgi:hypothetical protein